MQPVAKIYAETPMTLPKSITKGKPTCSASHRCSLTETLGCLCLLLVDITTNEPALTSDLLIWSLKKSLMRWQICCRFINFSTISPTLRTLDNSSALINVLMSSFNDTKACSSYWNEQKKNPTMKIRSLKIIQLDTKLRLPLIKQLCTFRSYFPNFARVLWPRSIAAKKHRWFSIRIMSPT